MVHSLLHAVTNDGMERSRETLLPVAVVAIKLKKLAMIFMIISP